MGEPFKRNIFYFENYYLDFFEKQNLNVQKKFNWTLLLISTTERVPENYFKYIKGSNGLFEIRVEVASNIYRVFCFFDEENLIIIINGFQKKSNKTPKAEIKKAEIIKTRYFNEK